MPGEHTRKRTLGEHMQGRTPLNAQGGELVNAQRMEDAG